jgi:predicted ATP-binding protein involved in virulence
MGEHARIRRIQVSKLFGIFDHEIPLNLNERITIIHGPNGYGKTVILQLVDGLFRRKWTPLCRIPFDELLLELADGGVIRVKQEAPRATKAKKRRARAAARALVFSYLENPGAEPRTFDYEEDSRLAQDFPTYLVERHLPFLRSVTAFTWRDMRSDEVLSLEEIQDRYAEELPVSHTLVKEPGWMKALRERLNLRLIHTQRLGVIGDREPAVSRHSSEIVRSIKSLLATYASRSQELDSTFLDRLFQQGNEASLSMTVLEERLKQIEHKRTQLMALGFLDHEREPHRTQLKLDKSKREVLSIYVEDTERKLAVFGEMAQKVQLLTDAINKRFKYKRMSISKEGGFVFQSIVDDTLLPLASLSSGEQHELVLLYELLFKVTPDTLVLIDEPELSLHLAWQQQFLGDLVEMVKLSSFDVIVATHSPGIIGKRWDLTVELKGPDLESRAR